MSDKISRVHDKDVKEQSDGLGGQIAGPLKYDSGVKLGGTGGTDLAKPQDLERAKEKFDKLKIKLEDFKKKIIKKYPFARALAILPANFSGMIEEDEGMPKEISDTKPMHIVMIIPEEEYKNISKIKPEVIQISKGTKENLWVHIKTEVDLWNYGLDSKFDFVDAVSSSFPLYDSGFLGALRAASIHKSLVLKKFEKYVATYAVGGSLVRGTASADSDVDTFVIIDDTDVKKMSRIELLEKLRGIIYEYIREATMLAGVKNILNVQVYLLTDFWQSVKDAQPVMFTFIRDGIPLYDRGTFIPWKLLLRMGRIKPSPEAIEQYMKQGEQTADFVKRRLLDAMVDIYYGIVTPTQAMMMLAGEAPPVPKTIVSEAKRVLVDRENVMNNSDLGALEKAVRLFKEYEYGKLKEFSGKEIDEFLKESAEYQKMLLGLRQKLEARISQKTAEEIYNEVFKILKSILGNKSQDELIRHFEITLVKKGKVQPRFLNVLKELVSIKKKLKAGKLNQKEVERAKRNAVELITSLVEYAQRADIISKDKGAMQIVFGGRKAELVLLGNGNDFLIDGGAIKRITYEKLVDSTKEEFEKAFNEHKGKISTLVSGKTFEVLKKALGEFEIVF